MQRRSWFSAVIGMAAVWATLGATTLAAPEAVAKPRGLVVVAGATGRTGKEAVAELVRRNYRVRAMVRDAAKAQGMFPAGVEIVVADVRDPAALAVALKGATYVISTIGASGGPGATPDAGPEQIDNQGVANLAIAAKGARVKHFVLVSSAAVTKAADYASLGSFSGPSTISASAMISSISLKPTSNMRRQDLRTCDRPASARPTVSRRLRETPRRAHPA
jgi:NAD(P)-dependent dehydrogenase (short-subunit alcohol dehydrogenase family)